MECPLRLGVIGCGAVTEGFHLPVLAEVDGVQISVIVDTNMQRAQDLAHQYGVHRVETDYKKILDSVDAVIVAIPNRLHAEVSLFFLGQKKPVLVEKPMALSGAECDRMIELADANNVSLSVAHVRRYFNNSKIIKYAIESGMLGDIRSFSLKEGGVFNWPSASGFYFDRSQAGGGALMDTGPHVLDLLLWWLGEPYEITYTDDNFGGVEASCVVKAKMKNGAEGIVKISRLVPVDTMYVFEGTRGTLRAHPFFLDKLNITMNNIGESELNIIEKTRILSADSNRVRILSCFKEQLQNFIDSIRKGVPLIVDGREGKRVVELIERCYAQRQEMEAPWLMNS
ncbi:MAG TPA: Gfo/Idh/MocA family oxidoreductase [Syntrophorhabdus sp.]|nr:Gfo/Idh/MocA family oxidoreductase [Syntrophorhabdus sp.]